MSTTITTPNSPSRRKCKITLQIDLATARIKRHCTHNASVYTSSDKYLNERRRAIESHDCCICLESLATALQTEQGVGKLDCCEHLFCGACIHSWTSKHSNTCPTCRCEAHELITCNFNLERVSNPLERVDTRPGLELTQDELDELALDEQDQWYCAACGGGDNEDLILLCDSCDRGYHTYCCGLGLEVPEGDWFCEVCQGGYA